MKIATARKMTSKNWVTKDIPWEELLQQLRTPLRTGETMREYKAMSREEKGYAKGAAGGFVGGALSCGQRKTENVTCRSMLTLDADNAYEGQWDSVTALHEFAMCCYSTHSSTPKAPRLRWIIPTDREMTPDEYPAVSRRVASWFGIDTFDSSTHELARLMFFPTVSKDATYEWHEQDGELLRVDDVLRTYGENPDAWRNAANWPIGSKEDEITRTDIKRRGDPTEAPGIVGLFCRAYDVPAAIDEFLSDVYTEAGTGRYTYAKGSSFAGARVYNDGAYLYSSHETDPAAHRSQNAFDLVRIHKFGYLDDTNECEGDVPVSKLRSTRAMTEWASGLDAIKRQRTDEAIEQMSDMVAGSAAPDFPAEDPDWQTKLTIDPKTGTVLPTRENCLLLLQNAPNLRGRFGYNTFCYAPWVRGDLPWRTKPLEDKFRGDRWTDADDAGLRTQLEKDWGFKGREIVTDAFLLCTEVYGRYNPVQEYLRSLKWDGVHRIDAMLSDVFGAEDTAYTRCVSRKWMIGAANRILHPGCKMDYTLVLVGAQGMGKSTFASVISRGWYNSSEIDIGAKDGYQSLWGNWVIELAELSSSTRKEVETVKSYISQQKDVFRPSYGRLLQEFPRQCVFLGTTNAVEFLRDTTGNRRWWPVEVGHRADLDALRPVVDQLWAEAVQCVDAGELPYFDAVSDPEAFEEWNELVNTHTEENSDVTMLQEALDKPIPENWNQMLPGERYAYMHDEFTGMVGKLVRRDRVCGNEVRFDIFGEDFRRVQVASGAGRYTYSRMLAQLPGWKKTRRKQRCGVYGVQYVYERTPESAVEWDKQHAVTQQTEPAVDSTLSSTPDGLPEWLQ